MLNHIGISISDPSEINTFYQEILEMKLVKQFTLNSDLSKQIFQINKETNVFLMQKDNLILEIFINENSALKQYNHICVNVYSRSKLIKKAKEDHYTCTIIPRKKHDLVFIEDKTGNVFEIKEK